MPSDEYFSKQVFSKDLSTYKVVKRGQFAYATIHLDEGSLGYAPETCLVSPMYTVFEVDQSRADNDYLLRLLKSPKMLQTYSTIGRGSAERRRSISLETLGAVKISLPPLPEQRRIASLLNEISRVDALNARFASATNDLAREAFRELFARDINALHTVQGILANVPNAIRTGPFGSQLLHAEFVNEGVAVLGIDSTVGNEFHELGARYITAQKYESLRRYTVRPGDVLVTIMGTIGRTAIVPDSIGPAINTKHLCCITTDRRLCLPEYLQYYFLYHPVARKYLAQTSKGSIMNGLNMGLIRALPVVLPPISQQEHFVRVLTEQNRVRSLALRRATLTKELLRSAQHRAFRGEL